MKTHLTKEFKNQITESAPTAQLNVWFPWKELEASMFLSCQGISFGDILPRFEESRFVWHTKVKKNNEVTRWQCDDLYQLQKEIPSLMKEFHKDRLI